VLLDKLNSSGNLKMIIKSISLEKISTTLILFFVLISLFIVFSLLSPHFRSYNNIFRMLINSAAIAVAALGLSLVMFGGGIDLSIGGNVALTSSFVAYLYTLEVFSINTIILLSLIVGLIIGLINGILITKVGINAIICTLGTMAATTGLGFVLTEGRSVLIREENLLFLSRGTLGGIAFPFVLIPSLYLGGYLLMNKSQVGRKIYMMGSNPKAAVFSSLKIKKYSFVLYIFCGIFAAYSGLLFTSRSAVGMPQHGLGFELEVIGAVILGGTALEGGKGTVGGVLLGVLIMAVIFNGLTILGVDYYYVQIIRGALIILIVATYEIRT